jgi:K+-sensing histidine kinase KdpD
VGTALWNCFFLPPYGAWSLGTPEVVATLVFLIAGLGISGLAGRVERAPRIVQMARARSAQALLREQEARRQAEPKRLRSGASCAYRDATAVRPRQQRYDAMKDTDRVKRSLLAWDRTAESRQSSVEKPPGPLGASVLCSAWCVLRANLQRRGNRKGGVRWAEPQALECDALQAEPRY